MKIDASGHKRVITDEQHAYIERCFSKISRQVPEFTQLDIHLSEERNPAIQDSQVAEATLYLKGAKLHVKDSSPDILHSIHLCAEQLARQVKRHRDKQRSHTVGQVDQSSDPETPIV